METYVRIVSALSRAAAFLAVGLLVAAILVICQMLVIRHGLGRSAVWQNEFVTFALVAATFLAAPYVLLVRGHVVVELVPIWLPPRARRILGLVAAVLGFSFCAVVFATSLEWWWEAWRLDLRTSTMWRARLWIPYLSLPLGSLLLTLQYLAEVWEIATNRKPAFGNPHEVGA
ncbi:MAG: TRAP transporter small permease subunit [Geminicoccaceae bacterium]|nr:TRAP transporter small permease subunit [Geminicoccaceae bacterium]